MNATRAAVVLGAIPVLIGVLYFVLQQAFAIENASTPPA